MRELPEQIRALVDRSARPIALDEITRPESAVLVSVEHQPNRRRMIVGLAAAAVVALALPLAFLAMRDDSEPEPSLSVTPSTADAVVTPDCVATLADPVGCPRDIEAAEAILGIPLRQPTALPEGWAPSRHHVRIYPPGTTENPENIEVRLYNQAWSPGGENPADERPAPDYLQLRQRAVLPSESVVCNSPDDYVLTDGSVVCGRIYGRIGSLQWEKDGVVYMVTVSGLTIGQVLETLNSLS